MREGFWLALYRRAWIPALPGLRMLARARVLPRNWRVTERLSPASPWPKAAQPLWLHCASLGEAKGLWSLACALPPEAPLLLTAATPEGSDYLERQCAASGGARRARVAPLDHAGLMDAFLVGGGIRGLCLYEAELWPNALSACARHHVPVVLVAGRLTPEALMRYRRFGGTARRLLDRMAWIEAQSERDRDRFAGLTTAPVFTGQDYKAMAFLPGPAISGRGRSGFAFVSMHLAELRRILPVLPALQRGNDVIVFPRFRREFPAFAKLLEPSGFSRASLRPDARHLLVDGFGQVMELLPRCHTAFVGGSLIPRGCHNLWEPLASGCRILFGPHYRHQRNLAESLLARGLARMMDDPSELASLPAPAPGHPEACAGLVKEIGNGLEASIRACRERIIATFFSIAPATPAGRLAGLSVPAGGGNER
jgi:3-deoxy-D-manno-octulosonic-acid transferase